MGTHENLVALKKITTASAADVLGGKSIMHSSIKPFEVGTKVVGRAFTATTPPGDMLTCYWALHDAPKGSILVIDGGGYTEAAIWGSLMTLEAKMKNIAAVIIDGSIRDLDTIRELDFPIYAIASSPRDGSICSIGELETTITCGGATVKPGDYILGDDDGVVVISDKYIDHVLSKAKDSLEMEEKIKSEISSGKSLYDIFSLGKIVLKKEREDVTLINELIKDMGF
ncbi:MAG: RraA family protein [Candidatus Methanofastidiosia archaeon]